MLDYVHNVGFFKFLFILILAWLKNNTMIVYESYATSQTFVIVLDLNFRPVQLSSLA